MEEHVEETHEDDWNEEDTRCPLCGELVTEDEEGVSFAVEMGPLKKPECLDCEEAGGCELEDHEVNGQVGGSAEVFVHSQCLRDLLDVSECGKEMAHRLGALALACTLKIREDLAEVKEKYAVMTE